MKDILKQNENLSFNNEDSELDFYSKEYFEDLVENDAIDSSEEGFVRGYLKNQSFNESNQEKQTWYDDAF